MRGKYFIFTSRYVFVSDTPSAACVCKCVCEGLLCFAKLTALLPVLGLADAEVSAR